MPDRQRRWLDASRRARLSPLEQRLLDLRLERELSLVGAARRLNLTVDAARLLQRQALRRVLAPDSANLAA